LVYPDISATLLTVAGVIICALNLALYGPQMWIARRQERMRGTRFPIRALPKSLPKCMTSTTE
jgi:hypothetical protein